MRDYFRPQSAMQLPSTEYNFRPRNTTSVHGRQLPSTVENFRQHLLYLNVSFVAFSMHELKNVTIPVHEDHKILKHLFLLVIDL